MKKDKHSRKGFTLVELLIVIVVIGILSAMMMLSSTEAMSSAKASNIAANLRNFKTAVLAWYADHADLVLPDGKINVTVKENGNGKEVTGVRIQNVYKNGSDLGIAKYFNTEASFVINSSSNVGYCVKDCGSEGGATAQSTWFVGYIFSKGEDAIKEKLKNKASSLGLRFAGTDPQKKGDEAVWMKVLGEYNPN